MSRIRITLPPFPPAESATLVEWLGDGARYEAGAPVARLETESGWLEVTAPVACTLEHRLHEVGATLRPGAVLAEGRPGTTTLPLPSAAASDTVAPLVMPQAGNSMEEGTLLAWRVTVGDHVHAGQVICEIETDKANVEVEAEQAGRVARLVATAGQVVPVRQPIAYLAPSEEALLRYLTATEGTIAEPTGSAPTAAAPAAIPPQPSASSPLGRLSTRDLPAGTVASPAARKLALERGLSLAGQGSGPGGRIVTSDLDASPAPRAATDAAPRTRLSKMRRAIGNSLQRSKQTVPHFYVRRTVRADALVAFARAEKARCGATLNDVVLWACGHAAAAHPELRTQLDGDDLVEYATTDIGVAVALDDGLVVPVVRGVATRNLEGLAAETRRLIAQARTGQLERKGNPILTVTNLGMFGVEEFAAIINPPEASILAIGALREEAIVEAGVIRPGRVMTLTLSVDHRVVDGVGAARFLGTLAALLEDPATLGASGAAP